MTTLPALPVILSPPLTGRDAVADALYRCLLAFDLNDADLLSSSFTENGTLSLDGQAYTGIAAIRTECFERVGKLDTSHHLSNLRINISEDGNKAQVTATALAQHYLQGKGMADGQEGRLLLGLTYYADMIRDEAHGLWRIEWFGTKPTWREGDWAVVKSG